MNNKQCVQCDTIWCASVPRCACGHGIFRITKKNPSPISNEEKVKCPHCRAVYANDTTLNKHIGKMHRYLYLEI